MSVHKKLMQARIKLQQKDLKKTGQNKFAGYMYFELSDFLPTVQLIFSELDLCGYISYGEQLATLTLVDLDDNSFIEITSPMKEANLKGAHPIQNLGAVETYTRRYLWVTALEIVEHDALDSSEPIKQIAEFNLDFWLEKLNSSKDLNELKENYLAANKEATLAKDSASLKSLTKLKDEIKAKLS